MFIISLKRHFRKFFFGFLLCLVPVVLFYKKEQRTMNREWNMLQSDPHDLVVHDPENSDLRRFDVSQAHFQFLKNFKSPCYLEKLPDEKSHSNMTVYARNAYVTTKVYSRFDKFGGYLRNHMQEYPQGALIEDKQNICGKQGLCRVRCFPHFMLLGMAKSGTSDFFARIKSHPFVYGGSHKELFYWTQFRFQINASIGDYSELFDRSVLKFLSKPRIDSESGEKYYDYSLGDFTSVTFTDDVWWRDHPGNKGLAEPKYLKIHDIHSVVPSMKLIVILRNPSTRLYSSYNMFQKSGSPEDFHMRVLKSLEWWHNCTVVKQLPRRSCAYGSPPEMPAVVTVLSGVYSENNRWYGQLNVANYSGEIRRGMYAIFVKDWLSVFPKEQFLLLKTEEYSNDPLSTFNEVILPFLDLPQVSKDDNLKIDKSSHSFSRTYLPMLPETRKILDDFYEPFNQELADYLGDTKWLWKD